MGFFGATPTPPSSRWAKGRPPSLISVIYILQGNDETWHSYILPKEDPKTIWITWYAHWVLLPSAFFNRKLAKFGKLRNTHCTKNHIFFFRTSWKDGLSKKIAVEHDLSCIIGKDDISFSRKYDLTCWMENERWSFLKNTRKYDIFFRPPEKMVFPKRAAPAHDLSCTIWKDGIFFPKEHDLFSLGRKWKTVLLRKYMETWCIASEEKQVIWYIGSRFSLSLNLFGWRYFEMNNFQYFVPFSPQELCLGACLGANKGNHLSITG